MCSPKDAEIIIKKLNESSTKAHQLVERIRRSREELPEASSLPVPTPQQP
jgi:hypothetical protein